MGDISRRDAVKLTAVAGATAAAIGMGATSAAAADDKPKMFKGKDGRLVEVTKKMADNYATIAELAGEAAHIGFLAFMDKLLDLQAGGKFTTSDGGEVTFDQVRDFFAVLADASASFSFGPKVTSGQGTKFKPAIRKVDTEKFGLKMLVSGEFSCGGTIRW